eukprot:TRINITY_DN2461_c0_g1_i7.p2 TRINITY_DN2461_c0_g1~~TRINITY_DN2461_c0_g1_i7.p2  ORF type:complete len:204 (-),score=-24.79 TRINITY_DN2461_c0_g1_i7:1260-1871(-)
MIFCVFLFFCQVSQLFIQSKENFLLLLFSVVTFTIVFIFQIAFNKSSHISQGVCFQQTKQYQLTFVFDYILCRRSNLVLNKICITCIKRYVRLINEQIEVWRMFIFQPRFVKLLIFLTSIGQIIQAILLSQFIILFTILCSTLFVKNFVFLAVLFWYHYFYLTKLCNKFFHVCILLNILILSQIYYLYLKLLIIKSSFVQISF